MRGCNLQALNGLAYDCNPSMGGVLEALIANASDVTSVTEQDGMITAIAMANEAKFKRYLFRRNTASLTSNYSFDDASGGRFVISDFTMVFNRMETAKRIEMTALAANDLVVIVKDANGRYWLLGKDAPVNASAGDGLTGTARTDRNGYSITLQDNSLEMPFEVQATAIADVVEAE